MAQEFKQTFKCLNIAYCFYFVCEDYVYVQTSSNHSCNDVNEWMIKSSLRKK